MQAGTIYSTRHAGVHTIKCTSCHLSTTALYGIDSVDNQKSNQHVPITAPVALVKPKDRI